MTNTVDKQALLKDMGDTLTAYIKLYQGANAAEVKSWMDAIRSGKYDTAPSTERQADVYREALASYDTELRILMHKFLAMNFFTQADAVEKMADRMKQEVQKALSASPTTQPSGMQQTVKELRDWAATIINGYHHVLPYGLTQDGVKLVRDINSTEEEETDD